MKTYFSAVVTCFAIIVVSCTKNNNPVLSPKSNLIQVSGTVTLSRCNHALGRYTVVTGKPAWITLRRSDSLEFSAVTDDSSNIHLLVDTGTYAVVAETFNMPTDTIATLGITHDTSGIYFPTRMSFAHPDSMESVFWFYQGDPRLTLEAEIGYLEALNRHFGNPLDLSKMSRHIDSTFGPRYDFFEGITITTNTPSWKYHIPFNQYIAATPDSFPAKFEVVAYGVACLNEQK